MSSGDGRRRVRRTRRGRGVADFLKGALGHILPIVAPIIGDVIRRKAGLGRRRRELY